MERPELKSTDLEYAVDSIVKMVKKRLLQKGKGSFVSMHEVIGVIDEEWLELRKAIRLNDLAGFRKELIDIAVTCVIGMASHDHLEMM